MLNYVSFKATTENFGVWFHHVVDKCNCLIPMSIKILSLYKHPRGQRNKVNLLTEQKPSCHLLNCACTNSWLLAVTHSVLVTQQLTLTT